MNLYLTENGDTKKYHYQTRDPDEMLSTLRISASSVGKVVRDFTVVYGRKRGVYRGQPLYCLAEIG